MPSQERENGFGSNNNKIAIHRVAAHMLLTDSKKGNIEIIFMINTTIFIHKTC